MSCQTSQTENDTARGLLWTLREVTLSGRHAPRLDRLSLTLPVARVAMLGVSGAGKSSLLGLLAGFETPDSGEVTAHSSSKPLPVFWSPQDYGLWPHLTVLEHLEHVRPVESRTEVSVAEWLERFRLDDLAGSRPGSLSEGEQSRLSVARALASEADVLLLDEPLAHVDPVHREGDWRTVMDYAAEFCRGVVFSTHEPSNVRQFADHVVCLDRGQIQFAGPTNQLLYSPPDEASAWLLGPCNWLDEKSNRWFTRTDSTWNCLRPEETLVVPDSAGALLIVGVKDHGGGVRIELSHSEAESNLFLYTTHSPAVKPGTRVRIDGNPSPNRKQQCQPS